MILAWTKLSVRKGFSVMDSNDKWLLVQQDGKKANSQSRGDWGACCLCACLWLGKLLYPLMGVGILSTT